MTLPVVEVSAPSRLHFGLFSFGSDGPRQFGGAGVMIDRPGIHLRFEPAPCWSAVGPHAERASVLVQRLVDCWQLPHLPACRLQIVSAADDHIGLGTGTQLALAVTAGFNALLGHPPLDAIELARLAGRGARSAIGTHGFLQGGLLVDAGKLPGESLAPLVRRVALPDAWRFLLVTTRGPRGLSGEAERTAFGELPSVSTATADRLRRLACEQLAPAAEAGDFVAFSQALYDFGYQAGLCFAPRQGGPFASPRIAELVADLRQRGVQGVGQSSWGPTVFALLADEAAARTLQADLNDRLPNGESALLVSPTNCGAQVHVIKPLPATSR